MANTDPGFSTGDRPTAAAWNAAFAGKVDADDGVMNSGTIEAPVLINTRVSAALRAPGYDDDTTRGYKVGDYWLDQNGRMWKADQVTPFGVWRLYSTPPYPLDGITAPTWASGTRRLLSSYTGYLFRIQRASDSATLDVGYLSDGGPDVAAADAFVAGTTGRIVRFYDQAGSGLYATGTMTNGPLWDPSKPLVGKTRGISFQTIKNTIVGGASAVDHYLSLPAGLSWEPSNSTILMAAIQNHSGTRTDEHGLFSNSTGAYGVGQSYNSGEGPHGYGSGGTLDTHLPTSPHVCVFGITSSFLRLWCNGEFEQSGTTSSTTTSSGGYIGYATTPKGAQMQLGAFVIWSATQLSVNSTPPAVIPNVEGAFGIQRQFDDIVAVISASDGAGTGTTTGSNWPLEVMALLRPGTRVFNLASHGADTGVSLTYKDEFLGQTYAMCRGAAARRFVVAYTLVGNDLTTNTLAEIKANYQAYATYAKALGSNVRMIVITKTTRCGWAGDTDVLTKLDGFNTWIRDSYNTAIASGGVGVDGYADIAGNPLINDEDAATPTMCTASVSVDGVHLTSAGQSQVVGQFAKAINAMLTDAS